MNDNRSPHLPDGPDVLPRYASRVLSASLDVMPVVVVMGARQTGKSTLVRRHPRLRPRPYLSLDDFDLFATAKEEPGDLVRRAPEVTIDEVQRVPDLVRAIKLAVDEDRPRRPGRFVLTGSSNLLLMERISESLAGRAAYLSLWPLTRRELLGRGETGCWRSLLDTPAKDWFELLRAADERPADWRDAALRGGYPSPAWELATRQARDLWYRGYVQTYLERDLQTLASIQNLVDFHRLMRAMALRTGTVVNRAEVGRDTGITRPTVHRYIDLLETSCQLVRVEAYSVNRTKRLIKSPKYYWSDGALALFLAGESEPRGEHLENLVLGDLVAWRDGEVSRPAILYWRTTEGEEVDFVIEDGARLLPIEVKATSRPTASDARHLRTFLDQYADRVDGGLLLHAGEEVFQAAPGILAAPWWRVL